MTKIDISANPFQEMVIPFENENITLTLNFRDDFWFMGLAYKNKKVNGIRLASGVLLLSGKNFPFEVVINDNANSLDPFALDNFESGLFEFLILNRAELESVRGYAVE